MTYPMRFFLIRYSDWDVTTWAYGDTTITDAMVDLEWERDVEWFCKLARDQQDWRIVPSLHKIMSVRPAAYWSLWDHRNPSYIGPSGTNDCRSWTVCAPDGTRTKVWDKRGQGFIESHILEALIPQEAGVPYSEAHYPTDVEHPDGNRVIRWGVHVLGGQGDTTPELGGGGGGGVAAGQYATEPDPRFPYRDKGFGVVGDWRLHFAVMVRRHFGADARDPAVRMQILDQQPDCRDRLMVKEYPEARSNGGFAAVNPAHPFCHEMSHGCDIKDIHNPDLGERADGSFFYTAQQRIEFATTNKPNFMEPIPVIPVPEPEPTPPKLLSLVVPPTVSVKTLRSTTFTVEGFYSPGGVQQVTPELWENSGKFSAAVNASGQVVVTAGRQPGEGYLVVRYGGIETTVPVKVTKR